jgi:hypothetical protein
MAPYFGLAAGELEVDPQMAQRQVLAMRAWIAMPPSGGLR